MKPTMSVSGAGRAAWRGMIGHGMSPSPPDFGARTRQHNLGEIRRAGFRRPMSGHFRRLPARRAPAMGEGPRVGEAGARRGE